jgi:hypothetical protein
MLRIPHCLDNRLTDGGKVVSPTQQPQFTPQKHYYFNASGTHFCWRLSKPQGLVRPEGIVKFEILPHPVSNPRPSGLYIHVLLASAPGGSEWSVSRSSSFTTVKDHWALIRYDIWLNPVAVWTTWESNSNPLTALHVASR